MKLNVNKEMLLKNRFWIALGASLLVILVGMCYLQLYVDAEEAVKGLKKVLDEAKKKALPPFDNPATIKALAETGVKAKSLESVVWENSYKAQENLFQWAPQVEEEFNFLNGRFANEIKIDALNKDPKTWPADVDRELMHGVLTVLTRDWFKIKNRAGKEIQFFATMNLKNVTVAGAPAPILFADMKEHRGNKLLAVSYQVGHYFNDPLTISEQRTFAETYKTQIHDLLKEVNPLDDKGQGVVQLRNYLYNREIFPDEKMTFIRYVTQPWDVANDISKEAWIAQENLWIQREIYRILREANEKISTFVGVGGDAKSRPYTAKFRNSYFELDLTLQKDNSLKFKIKNLQNKRQKLDDLTFHVLLSRGFPAETIKMSSQPLEPAGDKQGKDTNEFKFEPKAGAGPRKGIYSVNQVLSWETAAVKRIDHISIGSNASDDISHSHRTYPDGLKSLKSLETPAPDAVKQPGINQPFAGARPAGRGAGGGNAGMLPHGLWKDRYWEDFSPQSRRIPVGIVIIVDQEHVDRVLTSFTNSKLRFLDTQVLLNAYMGSLQPPVVAEKKADGGQFPNFPLGPMGPRGGDPFGPRRGLDAGASAGGQDLETNMEMVIYGIMTLYERYPQRPTTAAAKTQ